ncbi:hypothetical protein [Halomonas sp. N3-2A]|uniref:hypothetical protein n=1 Tax=Halomonas sp. N3-2A TaxID=2014541 RepID=UPI000B5B4938|nr:hypothetical protein [Halomonas sp. N3-2A]ASK18900.1 hypothetical protein CEK60_06100 [Halomonas sp. N3-2A]
MTQRERFEAWAVKPPRNWWVARADENHNYLLAGEYLDEGVQRAWEGWQAACPEGYSLVPTKITAESGHKYALMGEFCESVKITCPECWSDDEADVDCEICYGHGEFTQRVPIEWDTIKRIHDRVVTKSTPPETPC